MKSKQPNNVRLENAYCSVSFLLCILGESAERTNLQRGENWQPWGIFCQLPSLLIKSSMEGKRDHHRVHTEWQLPLSGVNSIMRENQPWLVRVQGGACPLAFTISTIMYKVVMYAPAERADTLPLFLIYPYMYSVGITYFCFGWRIRYSL